MIIIDNIAKSLEQQVDNVTTATGMEIMTGVIPGKYDISMFCDGNLFGISGNIEIQKQGFYNISIYLTYFEEWKTCRNELFAKFKDMHTASVACDSDPDIASMLERAMQANTSIKAKYKAWAYDTGLSDSPVYFVAPNALGTRCDVTIENDITLTLTNQESNIRLTFSLASGNIRSYEGAEGIQRDVGTIMRFINDYLQVCYDHIELGKVPELSTKITRESVYLL